MEEGIRLIPMLDCCREEEGRVSFEGGGGGGSGVLEAELLLALPVAFEPPELQRGSDWLFVRVSHATVPRLCPGALAIFARQGNRGARINRRLQRRWGLDCGLGRRLIGGCKVASSGAGLGTDEALVDARGACVVLRRQSRVRHRKRTAARPSRSAFGDAVARRPGLRLELVHVESRWRWLFSRSRIAKKHNSSEAVEAQRLKRERSVGSGLALERRMQLGWARLGDDGRG